MNRDEVDDLVRHGTFHRMGAYGGHTDSGNLAQCEERSLSFTLNPKHQMAPTRIRIQVPSQSLLKTLRATPYERKNHKSLRNGQPLAAVHLNQLELRLSVAEPVPIPAGARVLEVGAYDDSSMLEYIRKN